MSVFLRLITLMFAAVQASMAWADVFRVGSDVHCTHPTLAAALAAAAANGPGRDEIRLTVGVETTNAAFNIEHTDVLIAGGYTACGVVSPGATAQTLIVGNGHDSVFYIGGGRNVELQQLAITNGGRHGIANGDFAVGGAVWLNGGVAILRGVRAMYNRARVGGALAVTGSSVLVIHAGSTGSTIEYNEAMLGGGIYVGERATLRMENDRVSVVHNAANGSPTWWENSGGGIYAIGGASTQSTVEVTWLSGEPGLPMPTPTGFLLAHNTTTGNGGGMALYGTASFTAMEATIRDNTAGDGGGGIHLYGNQLGFGASVQMHRRHSGLPGWLANCEGQYGCNRITGNVARQGGGILVMHGQLRLGQMLMAGNRSTQGGGAAISTGNIANVPSPVNRIWLDSMVIANNQCEGPTASSFCATLDLGAGPNQTHLQHLTLADNTLAAWASSPPAEVDPGWMLPAMILRSSIIEPKFGTLVVTHSPGLVDADCVMAPPAFTVGTRGIARSAPYAFVSRASYDYRPAGRSIAIDACDTSQLFDSELADPALIGHGSVDHPEVPNRLGPDARADVGAFEVTYTPDPDLIFFDDFED